MLFGQNYYRLLVVSASEKFNNEICALLPPNQYEPPDFAADLARATALIGRKTYDFVIINAPLPDGYGTELAAKLHREHDCMVLLLEKSAVCEEKAEERTAEGIFSLSKPTSAQLLLQGLKWMAAARERLRQTEARSEERVEELQLVSRAKCLLMEKQKMSEEAAHRYIEKQSMDRCVPKRETAKQIVHNMK